MKALFVTTRIKNPIVTGLSYALLLILGYVFVFFGFSIARFAIAGLFLLIPLIVFCIMPVFLEHTYNAWLKQPELIDWSMAGFIPHDKRTVYATDKKWKMKLYHISKAVMYSREWEA